MTTVCHDDNTINIGIVIIIIIIIFPFPPFLSPPNSLLPSCFKLAGDGLAIYTTVFIYQEYRDGVGSWHKVGGGGAAGSAPSKFATGQCAWATMSMWMH